MSLSTNAFTGTHSLCLFVVVVWFIYQLKREAKFVKWSRGALLGWRRAAISVLFGWQKAVIGVLSRLMEVFISPLYKSNRSRHANHGGKREHESNHDASEVASDEGVDNDEHVLVP